MNVPMQRFQRNAPYHICISLQNSRNLTPSRILRTSTIFNAILIEYRYKYYIYMYMKFIFLCNSFNVQVILHDAKASYTCETFFSRKHFAIATKSLG